MNQPSSAQRILAIIPARGNSKRLPGKNVRPLLGTPLIEYTIRAALKSPYIDKVVVSTDDEQIAAVASNAGVSVIHRPSELASDTASSADTVIHALDSLKKEGQDFSHLVLLQPTSPLRTEAHLDACFEGFLKGNFKSAISICPLKIPLHQCFSELETGLLEGFADATLSTQGRTVRPNGAIYLANVQQFRKFKRFHLAPCLSFPMGELESVDIDTLEDFRLCEAILTSQKTP